MYHIYPFLKNCDSLILEWFAELHDLSSLRIDGEWSHDQVGFLVDQFADQTWNKLMISKPNNPRY